MHRHHDVCLCLVLSCMAVIASTHSQCSMLCLSSGNRTSITSYCTILLEFVARPSSVIKILVALRFRRPMFLCMLRLCFSHMLVCHAGTSTSSKRMPSRGLNQKKYFEQKRKHKAMIACKHASLVCLHASAFEFATLHLDYCRRDISIFQGPFR